MTTSLFLRALRPAFVALSLTVSAIAASPATDARLPLTNPSFEQGLTAWTVQENISPMSRIDASAAHEGSTGLRIEDKDTVNGSSVISPSVPVVAGRQYRLTFWSRSLDASTSCGVYLRFRDGLGKQLPNAPTTSLPRTDKTTWEKTEILTIAPDNAVSADIWIHSYGSTTGSWDIDDFAIEDLDVAKGASTAAPPVKNITPNAATLPALPTPPVPVILKVDDLISTPTGGVPDRWKRITDFAIERKIKLSIGVIANSLEGEKPAYFAWLKSLQATGLIEFWFHGYDHRTRKENGKDVIEFAGQSYEEQKRRFDVSQKLATEKLGAPFHAFGPPGGGNVAPTDADLDATAKAMAEDPEMKWFLYPKPLDARGSQLQAAGKIRILDRVWAVNIENPLFVPNAAKFIEGYARNAGGRTFYVAQGHPAQWDDARWQEFVKLVDFLQQNHVPVISPSDLNATANQP